MIILNRYTSLKENEVGREILKDHLLLKKKTKQTTTNKNENPKHDTEKDEIKTRTLEKNTKVYLVDQLAKHGWRRPKTPYGRNAKLAQRELAQIMVDLLGV